MDSADRDRRDALYTEVSTAHAACSWGRLLTVSGLQAVQLSRSAKLQMLGASWLEVVEPGTGVHGVCPPVEELGLADALALLLGEEVLLALADGLALADWLGLALALAEALGLELGLPPAPLHGVPLMLNAVGVSIVPVRLKLAPIEVDAPVASAPFQLSATAVIALPDWVHVASQPLERVSDPA